MRSPTGTYCSWSLLWAARQPELSEELGRQRAALRRMIANQVRANLDTLGGEPAMPPSSSPTSLALSTGLGDGAASRTQGRRP